MANQEHLDLLKQGVEAWNQWRKEHPNVEPDLSEADLNRADLFKADFTNSNLRRANINRANLMDADLSGADLREADLGEADLGGVCFIEANLSGANLSGAGLDLTNFSRADLSKADLSGADLSDSNFMGAVHNETNLSYAIVSNTIFVGLDLRQIKGLDTLKHQGPSHIGIDTVYRSKGYIPESFLRKAGVPDTFIEYMRSLVVQPFDYYTCFISYSSKDQAFAERLYADLQQKGVRCWFAPEHMKIGDKIRHRIDESIHLYDKLLLVLSEHSVISQWVEHEVETALAKEREAQPHVLFPIRLDETVMQLAGGWPALMRNTRHIGDFSRWKHHDDYQQAFERLLRDLKAE